MKKLIYGVLAASMLLGTIADASAGQWKARIHGPSMAGSYNDIYVMSSGDLFSVPEIIGNVSLFADAIDDCVPGGVGETKGIIKKIVKDVRESGLKKHKANSEVITKFNEVMQDKCGWSMIREDAADYERVSRPTDRW